MMSSLAWSSQLEGLEVDSKGVPSIPVCSLFVCSADCLQIIHTPARSVGNAQASHQYGWDLVIIDPANQHAPDLRAVVRMIEGGFFQSIQNETGTEASVEEDVQGTVEVVLRDGLTQHGNAFLRAVVEVFRDLDRIGRDDFAVDRGLLGTVSHTGVVEA